MGKLVLNTISENISWCSLFEREFDVIYQDIKHAHLCQQFHFLESKLEKSFYVCAKIMYSKNVNYCFVNNSEEIGNHLNFL